MSKIFKSCCSLKTKTLDIPNSFLRDNSATKVLNSNMSYIPGGTYLVGSSLDVGHKDDFEGPVTEVNLHGFYMDNTTVTNEQFSDFVNKTSYVTLAEEIGSSYVFYSLLSNDFIGKPVSNMEWWVDVKNANWRFPFGDTRSFQSMLDHPVVHISVRDALAYAKWAGKRLPNEIEWEVAAKGGTQNELYPWGNYLVQEGRYNCNIWQGSFPYYNTLEDGFLGTAPVKEFYRNDYGIYQMIGNVWEICSNCARIPHNLIKVDSIDDQIKSYNSNSIENYSIKGGSFLCHHSYCNRYRIAARNSLNRFSTSSNTGFRCVKDV